jgi:hypothetical protein
MRDALWRPQVAQKRIAAAFGSWLANLAASVVFVGS